MDPDKVGHTVYRQQRSAAGIAGRDHHLIAADGGEGIQCKAHRVKVVDIDGRRRGIIEIIGVTTIPQRAIGGILIAGAAEPGIAVAGEGHNLAQGRGAGIERIAGDPRNRRGQAEQREVAAVPEIAVPEGRDLEIGDARPLRGVGEGHVDKACLRRAIGAAHAMPGGEQQAAAAEQRAGTEAVGTGVEMRDQLGLAIEEGLARADPGGLGGAGQIDDRLCRPAGQQRGEEQDQQADGVQHGQSYPKGAACAVGRGSAIRPTKSYHCSRRRDMGQRPVRTVNTPPRDPPPPAAADHRGTGRGFPRRASRRRYRGADASRPYGATHGCRE